MVQCFLCVSLHNFEITSKMLLWTWELGSFAKTNIFYQQKVENCNLRTCQKNPLVHFSLHYNNSLVRIWVFWKQQTAWHFLLESHLKVQFYLIRVTSGMLVNTHRTLYPAIFSHQMVHCVPVVSIHHSENVQNIFLWTWELGPNGKISIFPLVKAGHFQP